MAATWFYIEDLDNLQKLTCGGWFRVKLGVSQKLRGKTRGKRLWTIRAKMGQ